MKRAAALVFLAVVSPALAQAPQPASPPGFASPPKADAPASPVAAAGAVHSETATHKTGKTGREIFVGSYITVDATCKVGKQPTIEFTQQPANGTVRKKRDAYNLRNAPGLPRNKCLGVSPEGLAVVYGSKPRFKGDDTFAYTVTFPDGRTRTVQATITVQ